MLVLVHTDFITIARASMNDSTAVNHLPAISEFQPTDSIAQVQLSELHMLQDLLYSALYPRVQFCESMAKMRAEAYEETKKNIQQAIDLISKVK